MNISEQFTISECMRPSFEGSVNMDLQDVVDEDDYLRKEVSCSSSIDSSYFRVSRSEYGTTPFDMSPFIRRIGEKTSRLFLTLPNKDKNEI